MTGIFNADQAARASPASIDWKIVLPADAVRRTRTQALLDLGILASGDDFYHAAYVFQHGDTPDDFLKAHALAVIAISRGRFDATWIAAATLDRYLQRIGQPQYTARNSIGQGRISLKSRITAPYCQTQYAEQAMCLHWPIRSSNGMIGMIVSR